MQRKHTVSECVTDNGDLLVVRKKAREAEKAKKTTQVIFYHLKENINSLEVMILQKASVEDVDDEDSIHTQKDIPKKDSRILEHSDGSDDEDDELIVIDCDGDTEIMDSGDDCRG